MNRRPDDSGHDPHVIPYQLATEHYVVRCRCGLNEEHNDRDSADAAAAAHRAETRP